MADRVYPASKPIMTPPATNGGSTTANGGETTTNGGSTTTNGGATTTAAVNPFPPNKAQLYNANRPRYRPQPPPRHRRSCCCRCCLWSTCLLVIILILIALAGAIFWAIFRPQKPSFAISNLELSQFNLTTTSVISKFNLTVSARNPNARITYFYDPIKISILSHDVTIGDGSFPDFVHGSKNKTVLRTTLSSSADTLESTDIATLQSDIKNKKSLPLKVVMETKVKVKIGALRTKRITIRVTCDGGQVAVPTGKNASTAKISDAKCEVDPRVKVLSWTF